jgi:ferrous iron transport protein B
VFVTQTGPIILVLSGVLWATMTFPKRTLTEQERSEQIASIEGELTSENIEILLQREEARRELRDSYAGRAGRFIEPVIEPLGFDWKIGIGLVGSFAAREVLVSTLGQVYGIGSEANEESLALRQALLADKDPATGHPRFTPLIGVSLMVFFVLAMQCMSTVAVVRRETNSWKWPLLQLTYMNALAWLASFITYQGGLLLGLG